MTTAQRKRRKASAASRVRPFWIPIVLAAVAVAAAAYFAATWEGFRADGVRVEGNRLVPSPEIVAAAAIAPGTNIWLMRSSAMVARVERIPYVETARVRRSWPNHMTLAIAERRPYARLRTPAGDVLIDRSLRVLQPYGDPPLAVPPELPRIDVKSARMPPNGAFLHDAVVAGLRDANDMLVAHGIVPSELHDDAFGGLVIVLRDGISIQLGEGDDLEKKISLIEPILQHVRSRVASVRSIDLRAPATPVVEYKK